jgi:hypothetical protein
MALPFHGGMGFLALFNPRTHFTTCSELRHQLHGHIFPSFGRGFAPPQ